MTLQADKSKLVVLTRKLSASWQQTRNYWRDERGLAIEKQYIDDLRPMVDSAAETVDQLDRILTKIRRDCEE